MHTEIWNGTGLPPVGVACIVAAHNTQWGFGDCSDHECKVISYCGDYCWIDLLCDGIPVATRNDKVSFRPIKSDREKFIELFNTDFSDIFAARRFMAEKIYDAGYRKQESEK